MWGGGKNCFFDLRLYAAVCSSSFALRQLAWPAACSSYVGSRRLTLAISLLGSLAAITTCAAQRLFADVCFALLEPLWPCIVGWVAPVFNLQVFVAPSASQLQGCVFLILEPLL